MSEQRPPEEGTPPEGGGREPTPEEVAALMAAQLGRIPVRDFLLQTMATFTDLAAIRLGMGPQGAEVRDLTQARLAIECLRGLIGVAEAQLGAAQAHPFREPLARLQLIYAREAEAAKGTGEGGGPAADEGGEGPPPGGGAASRLWTPPGTRR